MINQVFTSKGMIDAALLTRSVVWDFTENQIVFKEQYRENATGELVKSSCDIFQVPTGEIKDLAGALNG